MGLRKMTPPVHTLTPTFYYIDTSPSQEVVTQLAALRWLGPPQISGSAGTAAAAVG